MFVHCNPHSTQLSSALTLTIEEMMDKELLDDDDDEESDSYDNGGDDHDNEVTTYHKPITFSAPSTRHPTPKLSIDSNSQLSAITAELLTVANPTSPNLIDHGQRNRLKQRVLCHDMVDLAASFWAQHVHSLSIQHRSEIGCSALIVEMMDIMGWILRMIKRKQTNLQAMLHEMGELYAERGVGIDEYSHLLHGLHSVFALRAEYTTAIRLSVDEVMVYSVQKMTGSDLKIRDDADFGESLTALLAKGTFNDLDHCMATEIGREYLFRYLHQAQCSKIVLFLQFILRYKEPVNRSQRTLLSAQIDALFVDSQSAFCLDLSRRCRTKIAENEKENDKLKTIEIEVEQFIIANHWMPFVQSLRVLC